MPVAVQELPISTLHGKTKNTQEDAPAEVDKRRGRPTKKGSNRDTTAKVKGGGGWLPLSIR